MDRKNLMGRALRSGILMTAAAAMLMGNITAFAAEDEETAGVFWQQNLIAGTVTEVGTDSITVRAAGAMEDAGFAMGMPGNGMQPGGQGMEMPDGQTPPEPPEGEGPEFTEGELPEPPEGMNGQPGGQGMGMPGGFGMGMPSMGGQSSSEVVVNVDAGTVITKGGNAENADFSDITVGSNVVVSLDGDTALAIVITG